MADSETSPSGPVQRALKFERAVESTLIDARVEYSKNFSSGGLRADFVVLAPTGQTIVIEAKALTGRIQRIPRALHQLEVVKEAVGADASLLVVDAETGGSFRHGSAPQLLGDLLDRVVTLDRLADTVQATFERLPGSPGPTRPPARGPTRMIFAAMPFDGQYDDTFLVAMRLAANSVNGTCLRLDYEEFSGDVIAELERLIRESDAVIADLSGANPNVLYEVGYAHALEVPTVHISATPLNALPFDVRNWNTLPYSLGRTSQLTRPLSERLAAVLQSG